MAKIQLTQENVDSLYRAFDFYFPDGTIYARDSSFSAGSLKWNNLADFLQDIEDTSEIEVDARNLKTIKAAQNAIESKFAAETKATNEKPESNVPQNREDLEKERAEREAAKIEAKEKAEAQTRQEIETRQKYAEQKRLIQEQYEKVKAAQSALENKKIYAKVENPSQPTLSEIEQAAYGNLKDLAQKNPLQLQDDISKAVEASIPQNLKESAGEEWVSTYAESTAYRAVSQLRMPSAAVPDHETAILASAATNPEIIQGVTSNTDVQEVLFQGTNELARLKMMSYQAPSDALDAIFGPNIRKLIIGPSPAEIRVSFQQTPDGATHELDFSKVNLNYQSALQNPVFQYGQGEIKARLLDFGRQQLISKIESLPPDSFLGKFAATEEFQGVLTMLQPYTSFEFVGAEGLPGMIGRFVAEFSPESAPMLTGLGNMLGIDFGFTTISTSAVAPIATDFLAEGMASTVTSITASGGIMAGEAFAGGAGAAMTAEVVGGTAAVTAEVATGTAIGAAGGATAGSVVPIVGTIIGAVVGFVIGMIPGIISWVSDKYNKNKEMIVAIPVAGLVTVFAGPLAGLAGGFGAYGLTSYLAHGMSPGLSNWFSGALSFLKAVFINFFLVISTPVIITLVSIAPLIVLILIIINSGAYVVPPGMSLLNSANPYLDVQKVANPPGPLASPAPITYTVTITAKKDALSQIRISASCSVITNSGASVNCPPENIPSAPAEIQPGTPFTFTFTSNYDSRYQDSLVTDTITVTATSPSVKSTTASATASVCFGKCPLGCFKTVDNDEPWPAKYKANLDAASGVIAGTYKNFATKICAAGTVNLCYTTKDPNPIGAGLCNQTIYARHIHTSSCDIVFNQCGLGSQSDAVYILAHESTHHIQKISPNYESQFEQAVPQSEWYLCTYSATRGDPYESMAEGDALYTGTPSWSGCVTNYMTQYPKHYQFAKSVMFGQ